jgi:hypothetical protein
MVQRLEAPKQQDGFGEYLGAAMPPHKHSARQKEWLQRQQGRLLNNQPGKVLKSLAGRLEPENTIEAPVRAAYDYIKTRIDHLDYQSARKNELPIGSGEVESGHGHVIQDRLKLAGCWWKETNAAAILNLRVARANSLWQTHWSN